MAAMQESSVLFSLKNLMALEEQRVREEQEALRHKVEAEEAARLAAERAAREEEEARLRAEQERQRLDEKRRREEEARLEAMRAAAIERARAEAQTKARLEEMARQQEHERELAKLKEDGQKRRLKRALVSTLLSAVVLLGGGLGVYFGKIKPDAEARAQELAARRESAELDIRNLEKKIQELEKKQKLASQDNDSIQRELEDERKKLLDLQAEKKSLGQPSSGSGSIKQDTKERKKDKCPEGDPLCSDI